MMLEVESGLEGQEVARRKEISSASHTGQADGEHSAGRCRCGTGG